MAIPTMRTLPLPLESSWLAWYDCLVFFMFLYISIYVHICLSICPYVLQEANVIHRLSK